jgi:cytochrome P450
MYYGYHRKSNENIRNLHLKYGNTVRVAPYIVSFDAPETIPQIYGVRSPFPKDWSAAKMDNFGAPCSFSTPLNADHRRRRNRFAAVYSKSSVTTGEGYQNIAKRTTRVLQKITENALKGLPTDIYWLFHYYAIDNVSLMASGTDTRLLHGENTKLSQDLRTGFDGLAYAWYFFLLKPFLAISRDLTEKLVPPRFVKAYDAHEAIREHNLQHYHKARDAEKVGTSEYNKSVLSKLQTHKDYQSPDLTEMHVASEISDHLLAGADTLVVGLTYLFWELALPHNGPILRRLQEELDTVGWDADGTPASYADVDALPYLELVYREALRVHAVSGNIQSRYVPEEGIVLNGHVIPKGIELGHPLYATMLNPEVFEDPKRFWPERWEEVKDGARLERMKEAWIPFGYGARICVGRE